MVRTNFNLLLISIFLGLITPSSIHASPANVLQHNNKIIQIDGLKNAIVDLMETFGDSYPDGNTYLTNIERILNSETLSNAQKVDALVHLQQKALLANPLLRNKEILLIKRKPLRIDRKTFFSQHDKTIGYSASRGFDIGLPSNHECNSSLYRTHYDNEIAILTAAHPGAELRTLYRPADSGYVGETDLHWDGDRLLFTKSSEEKWNVWEIGIDGTNLRQVTRMPDDIDSFDACYTPEDNIVFGSTASFQSVPCWHGQKKVSNLYVMDGNGDNVRQLCFDQDHDFHPAVMENGQILYNRWDYTGISHIFLRELMAMNPDGTGQRAVYGSNSWFPNSLYFSKPIPGQPGKLITILSGYHGDHRMGQLVIIDTQKGWFDENGLVQRISGRGQIIDVQYKDNLTDQDWPKFLHPYTISDKHFLVSALLDNKSSWGIYLADVYDNLVLICEEPGTALLEPVLIEQRKRPPIIPNRVDPNRDDAVVYLQDVHIGRGLLDVPRGIVKSLRVIAYNFGYLGLAGPDKTGYSGPWEVMRILGTVDLERDGSAIFKVPANTPLALQALDEEGKAVQLMRSWFTAMPGETVSCIGCHESPNEVPSMRKTLSSEKTPEEITPWNGPARGFDFTREIQPVLNQHCVSCHNGNTEIPLDLRPREQVPHYEGVQISTLGLNRLDPRMRADFTGKLQFTPAYDALIHYIRRVNIEDDVKVLVPGEYHAGTSELIQILEKGHQGVFLDKESINRFVTWIDLNAPCYGTWCDVHPLAKEIHERRKDSWRRFGGPSTDPEIIPAVYNIPSTTLPIKTPVKPEPVEITDWPLDETTAARMQQKYGETQKTIQLPGGIELKLVLIPAGKFVMGDANGQPDEYPQTVVEIEEPFWMGACEITNEQFRLFDPTHDSRYYVKRHTRADDRGRTLNNPQQPVVRVSWQEADAYCKWLSEQTGMQFSLPTEAQWEYACRAGSDTPLSFGDISADFTAWGNMADLSFSKGYDKNGNQVTGGVYHLVMEGAKLSDTRYDDRSSVTQDVGSYRPNRWGLFDMHGNAAEWTLSQYRAYPYEDTVNAFHADPTARRTVRGGSFFDRPKRSRAAFRLAYPQWRKVFNVGFRIAGKF